MYFLSICAPHDRNKAVLIFMHGSIAPAHTMALLICYGTYLSLVVTPALVVLLFLCYCERGRADLCSG